MNLAAEFTSTPFDKPFASYMNAVASKQSFETSLIKGFVTNLRNFSKDIKEDAKLGAAFATVKERLGARHATLETESRKALVPVKYSASVE